MPRMMYAALAAVGKAAISAPMNGPERSTTTEMTTTIDAVIAIFRTRPIQNRSSGDMWFTKPMEPVMARAGGPSSIRRRWYSTAETGNTGSSAGACHRAGHFGPDPLADEDARNYLRC